jgi:hypothetical protein
MLVFSLPVADAEMLLDGESVEVKINGEGKALRWSEGIIILDGKERPVIDAGQRDDGFVLFTCQ